MRLVHESTGGARRILATDVETADSVVDQTRGLMFRRSIPDDYALVFRFEAGLLERLYEMLPAPLDRLTASAAYRNIHMVFVRVPLDVIWLQDGRVVKVRTLQPWRGRDGAAADKVIEMAAGAAASVEPGDRIHCWESSGRLLSPPVGEARSSRGGRRVRVTGDGRRALTHRANSRGATSRRSNVRHGSRRARGRWR